MRYTAIESLGEARIEVVKGCTTCPHMTKENREGKEIMICTRGPSASTRRRMLLGNWTGNFHESCPLPKEAKPFSL